MSRGPKLYDLKLKLHAETEKAVHVSETGEKKDAVWLPKSQVEVHDLGNGFHEVTIPEWLVEKHDFTI